MPTCPEWTLFDLVQHLGDGRRKWAAIVAAGPAEGPADKSVWGNTPAPCEREALLDWWTESAQLLLDALKESGPDAACWTWWNDTQTPQTTGAAARHQLHEIAVHTYDAQVTGAAPQPLPQEVALDGAEEFLSTSATTTAPWPHKPTTFDFHATEGLSWRLTVDGDGSRLTRLTEADTDEAPFCARGTAADLVLYMHGRTENVEVKDADDQMGLLLSWDC